VEDMVLTHFTVFVHKRDVKKIEYVLN